jgi:hypothetical protein
VMFFSTFSETPAISLVGVPFIMMQLNVSARFTRTRWEVIRLDFGDAQLSDKAVCPCQVESKLACMHSNIAFQRACFKLWSWRLKSETETVTLLLYN